MRWISLLLILVVSACSRLDISSIGLHTTVVTGGQEQINEGYVVDYDGLPGIWLAGHHTTHGAVFRNLGNVNIGDSVCVYSHCYTVFAKRIVCTCYIPPGEIAPVVLQTSWFGSDLLVLAH